MQDWHYLVITDFILLLVFVKLIFGSVNIFIKAILGNVFSDFSDLETFRKWDKEHDIHHKINILYAVILGLGILSFVVFVYWL